jgi:hypothetical protein
MWLTAQAMPVVLSDAAVNSPIATSQYIARFHELITASMLSQGGLVNIRLVVT